MSASKKPQLEFPCDFGVKVIGKDEKDFVDFVYELVARHVPELEYESLRTADSSGGKYISVTAQFTAKSRKQLDALYRDLGDSKRVLYVI